MDYDELKKRIDSIDYNGIFNMTPQSVVMLTNGYKEPLVRLILAKSSDLDLQKNLFGKLVQKYKAYYIIPLPTYFATLQFDIDCGILITADDESSAEEKPTTEELTDPDAIRKRMDELAEEYYRLKEKLGEEDEDEDEEDEDEEKDAEYWKEELTAFKERQHNRAGINRLQSAHLGLKLAPKLGIHVNNKKELAPVLSKIFGWGENSMEKRLCEYLPEEEEMDLANIFGVLSPELAKYICAKWEGTPTPEDEAPPTE